MQQDGPRRIFIDIYEMLIAANRYVAVDKVHRSLFSLEIKSHSISSNTSFFTLSDDVMVISL